jgi:hypothetical protein
LDDIGSLEQTELVWIQPNRFLHRYELRAGKQRYAELNWEKSNLNERAVAKTKMDCWWIKSTFLISPRITVRCCKTEDIKTIFEVSLIGQQGMVRTAGGEQLLWGPNDLLKSSWAFFDSNGQMMMNFQVAKKFLKSTGLVQVDPKVIVQPAFLMLAVLGWYSLMLNEYSSLFIMSTGIKAS